MTSALLDAFDAVVFSEATLKLLREAQQLMAKKQLPEEKQWLAVATDRLAAACEGLGDLATRSSRLPELEPVREELARTLQNRAIDAVERLQAAITFHAGPRAPVLEELFGQLKLPALRRAARADFEKFIGSFSKRLKTQYVRRIFADADFAFALPAVAQLSASFDAWRGAFSTERLPEGEEAALQAQLTSAARSLELPLRQARLLAEAALLPLGDAFAESGLGAKPKKRAAPRLMVADAAAPVETPVAEALPEAVAEPAAPAKKKAKRPAARGAAASAPR